MTALAKQYPNVEPYNRVKLLLQRFAYTSPSPEQVEACKELRIYAGIFANQIVQLTPPSRGQSLALTSLEEAVLWSESAVFARSEE